MDDGELPRLQIALGDRSRSRGPAVGSNRARAGRRAAWRLAQAPRAVSREDPRRRQPRLRPGLRRRAQPHPRRGGGDRARFHSAASDFARQRL